MVIRSPADARRGLAIYLSLVVIASAALEWWIITHGGLNGPAGSLVLVLMYVPAFASIVARLVGREGFGDVSFRWGGRLGTRASLAAWLLPVVIGTVAYGIAWSTGLAGFAVPAEGMLARVSNPLLRFLLMIPAALTIGTLYSGISAFGEELGWRGYLVPRLHEAGVPRPDVVSTLIWCFWHVPLILWGGYAVGPSPLLSALLFVAAIMPVGLLMARWRMTTGSVWPAVIAHASWNIVIQGVFDYSSTGEKAALWIGESGILTVIVLWATYVVVRNAAWAGTAAPKSASAVTASAPTT
jgi:membrane protease YdiL (CAAX protease family)